MKETYENQLLSVYNVVIKEMFVSLYSLKSAIN